MQYLSFLTTPCIVLQLQFRFIKLEKHPAMKPIRSRIQKAEHCFPETKRVEDLC